MKIFVTVGTTPFDTLIEYLDLNVFNHEIIAQTSASKYIPVNIRHFNEISTNIDIFYEWADIVIVGSNFDDFYKLFELNKYFIIIPNLKKISVSELRLLIFFEKLKYIPVIYNLNNFNIEGHCHSKKHMKKTKKARVKS